jgi:D-alanine-D-alanine ligase
MTVNAKSRDTAIAYNVEHVKRLRIGVLHGGRSGEHEVSIASAAAVFANLDRKRYEPVAIRIEKDGRWRLLDRPPSAASAADVIDQMREAGHTRGGRDVVMPARPGDDTLLLVNREETASVVTGLGLDVIFPVLHGPYGEDGTVQGLLDLADVPYVGCGVLASAAGMDKDVMKVLFQARGLRVTPWVVVRRHKWLADRQAIIEHISDTLTYPVFVKPANLGSSVGISKVASQSALGAAIDLAASFDPKVIVETGVVSAREIECAVLGNEAPEASVPGEIVPAGEFYDYNAKYLDSGSKTIIPASIPSGVADEVRRESIIAFDAIDGSGLARVDFLLSVTEELFINEINTMPGFTTISMYSKLWEASGVSYPQLIDRLITLAMERHAVQQQRRVSAF